MQGNEVPRTAPAVFPAFPCAIFPNSYLSICPIWQQIQSPFSDTYKKAAVIFLKTKRQSNIVIPLQICYTFRRCHTHSGNRRGVYRLELIISFMVSVMAKIVGYYLCKWLDRDDSDS